MATMAAIKSSHLHTEMPHSFKAKGIIIQFKSNVHIYKLNATIKAAQTESYTTQIILIVMAVFVACSAGAAIYVYKRWKQRNSFNEFITRFDYYTSRLSMCKCESFVLCLFGADNTKQYNASNSTKISEVPVKAKARPEHRMTSSYLRVRS